MEERYQFCFCTAIRFLSERFFVILIIIGILVYNKTIDFKKFMIDNSQAMDKPEKYIPKIITAFKSRSTILLNQFHGSHGRVFWENAYESLKIDSVESFNEALSLLKKNID